MLPLEAPGQRLEVAPWLVVQSPGWGAAAPEPSVSALCPLSWCRFQKPAERQQHWLRPRRPWSLPWGPSSWFRCWFASYPTASPEVAGLWPVQVPPSSESIHRGPEEDRGGEVWGKVLQVKTRTALCLTSNSVPGKVQQIIRNISPRINYWR